MAKETYTIGRRSGWFAARKALEWTLEWCAAHGIDPDTAVAPAKPKRAKKAAA